MRDRRKVPFVCVSALVLVLSAPGALAAENWMTDGVSGCAIWSTDEPTPDEGVSWSGACVDGKASGSGVLTFWDKEGLVGRYTGEMHVGKVEGEGRLFLRDDKSGGFNQYLGRFANGQPVGQGFLTMADGSHFLGELIDGVEHAKGVLITPDGWVVKGEFEDGEGIGTLVVDYTTADGERYVGQAENGKRQGFGILTATDDDFYAGEFADGLPDGPGIYKGTGGDRYLGYFTAGKPDGFGTSIDPEGNVIQGRFVNGEPDGTVLVSEPDGTQSVTEWKAGASQ